MEDGLYFAYFFAGLLLIVCAGFALLEKLLYWRVTRIRKKDRAVKEQIIDHLHCPSGYKWKNTTLNRVKHLVMTHGEEILKSKDNAGYYPFTYAVAAGASVDIVQYLLENSDRQSGPWQDPESGESLLHIAAINQHHHLLGYLMSLEDYCAIDYEGNTPQRAAQKYKISEGGDLVLEMLCDRGATIQTYENMKAAERVAARRKTINARLAAKRALETK